MARRTPQLLWLPLFVVLLAGFSLWPTHSALQPQDVTTPFWEPLPFAELPIVLQTQAVFYQDSSVMGKVYTVGGQPDAIGGANLVQTNAVYRMDVGKQVSDLRAQSRSYL